jgi:VanZ family protein
MNVHNVPMRSGIRRVCQFAAWVLLLAITALSLVPSSLRPITILPHALEHFAIFFATGTAFAVGYPKKELLQLVTLIAFAGSIEFAQMWAPGRHARLSDFAIDASAACIGVAILLIGTRIKPALPS